MSKCCRHNHTMWIPQVEYLTGQLNQYLAEEFAGLKLRRLVVTGDPAHEIVQYAKIENTDLIMMPTHDRGPFRRFVLGSVTAKVLHDAVCPVWTSAHLDAESSATPENLASIVCAVDMDESGIHTLRYAGNLARQIGANLTMTHVVPAIEALPNAYIDTEFRADLIEAARARLECMGEQAECEGVTCVGAGNIARFVAHAAQSHKAGLVVIGRGGNGVLGRLRTHDYAIMRECECPVLSI